MFLPSASLDSEGNVATENGELDDLRGYEEHRDNEGGQGNGGGDDEEDGPSDPESEDTTYAADRQRSPRLALPQRPAPRLQPVLPIPPAHPPPKGGGSCPRAGRRRPPRRSLRHAALGNTVDQPEPVEQEQEPAAPIPENQPLSLEALNILSTVAAAAQAITAPPDYATNIFLKASQILDRLLAGVNTQEKDFDLLPSGVSLSDLGARIQAKEVLEVTSDFSAMLALLRWRLKLEWCVLFLILDFFLKMFPNAAVYERAGVVLTMSLRQK
jgi:hypothetical protein